jgi:septal ring factor EnvC (AmiA/AmiB activator)
MRILRALPATALGAVLGALAAPAFAADRAAAARPIFTPLPKGASAADVQGRFDALERATEQEYSKLIKEARDQQSAIEDKLRQIDRQVETLKNEVRRIELLQKKIEEVLPKILAFVGSDSALGAAPGARQAQVTALLSGELSKAGVSIPPDRLAQDAAAITKGGTSGLTVAWDLVLQIARAGSPAPRARLGPHAFPEVSSFDLSNAAQMPPASAAAFLSSTVSRQASEEIRRLNGEIDSLRNESKKLTLEIKSLEAEIAKLEADKAKLIAELKAQRTKAVEEANRLRSPAAIRFVPTATPTPGKR